MSKYIEALAAVYENFLKVSTKGEDTVVMANNIIAFRNLIVQMANECGYNINGENNVVASEETVIENGDEAVNE